ncbi:peptide-N-glycosidase F-related protein [Chondromyces crocatus]|uniref:Peptide-N-glycosidase F C-terminal domain-containing protein n=1 Tax=Chondromyces crocatus TaxID=52 RepID=A0A0K1EEC5_CHOCO|nr:peptide-N-glycosidase F-related protein [Chondromyces crocatus]AKT38933.1 uncharacterized protein CMC5_030800 [Chondromyces crocatus]
MHPSSAARASARALVLGAATLLTTLTACSTETAPDPGPGTGGAGGAPAAPYTLQALNDVRISSDANDEHFQQAFADIDLSGAPFASVKLVVELKSTCTPFETWSSNPPPEGHRWPADCDAYDRNFEISLDDPRADGDAPGIELIRAITPFGGPMRLEEDITDIANGMPGPHRLKAFIATWPDPEGQVSGANGGWNVNASLEVTPGPAPRDVLAVVPLFNGTQRGMDGSTPIAFQVPEGTTSARLEYRATGHGGDPGGTGCIGPAEEFCRRVHRIFVDDEAITHFNAWRDDCDTLCTLAHYGPADGGFDYCQENPCGAIESVRAPRANWCPGSVTPPLVFDGAAPVTPGEHRFAWTIVNPSPGGQWRLSAHYIAFGR